MGHPNIREKPYISVWTRMLRFLNLFDFETTLKQLCSVTCLSPQQGRSATECSGTAVSSIQVLSTAVKG